MDWHKYPSDPPKKQGYYIVKMDGGYDADYHLEGYWNGSNFVFPPRYNSNGEYVVTPITSIKAWIKLPQYES